AVTGRNGSAEWAASPPRHAEVQAAQRERRSSLVWFGLLGTALRRRVIASVDAPCLAFRRRRGPISQATSRTAILRARPVAAIFGIDQLDQWLVGFWWGKIDEKGGVRCIERERRKSVTP